MRRGKKNQSLRWICISNNLSAEFGVFMQWIKLEDVGYSRCLQLRQFEESNKSHESCFLSNILRAAGVIYRKCRMSSGMKHPRVKGQERCMIKKQEEKSPLNQMCYTLTWWTIFHADGGGVNTLRKWKLEVSRHQRGRGKNYRRPENRHSLPSDCCDQMFTCQSSVSVPNMTF